MEVQGSKGRIETSSVLNEVKNNISNKEEISQTEEELYLSIKGEEVDKEPKSIDPVSEPTCPDVVKIPTWRRTTRGRCYLVYVPVFGILVVILAVVLPIYLHGDKDNKSFDSVQELNQWNQWAAWSSCDTTCGFGLQQRNRSCTGADCPGNSTDTKPCLALPPCLSWSSWTSWGHCDKTCGTGKQTKTRNCTADLVASDKCNGTRTETKECVLTSCIIDFADCAEVFSKYKAAGVYRLKPKDSEEFNAYCDQGWTVLMRRFDGSQDFYLNWTIYKLGFGNISAEHWLGNENIYHLTNQKIYTIKFEYTYWLSGKSEVFKCNIFRIKNEENKYRISTNKKCGGKLTYHENKPFSTIDRDNDYAQYSCSNRHKGAFWYGSCANVNPTGLYKKYPTDSYYRDCMYWYKNFDSTDLCLSAFTMKIKPREK